MMTCGTRVRIVVDRNREGDERFREACVIGYSVAGTSDCDEKQTSFVVRDDSGFTHHKGADEVQAI